MDTAGQSPSTSDSDALTYRVPLIEVEQAFTAAGLPRSYRTLQRYCERGRLDCLKADTPVGEQYFVREASIERCIGELKQLHALREAAGHAQAAPAMSGDDAPTFAATHGPDLVGQSPSTSDADQQERQRSDTTSASDSDGQGRGDASSKYITRLERDVERLERELDTKNEQIGALLERDRETNILVGSLQRMLAPLLGNGASNKPDASIHDHASADQTDSASGANYQ